MSSTELERVPLPTVADPRSWTPQQAALMQFVGLSKVEGKMPHPDGSGKMIDRVTYAPIAIAEAFLAICRQTGLNPVARQIYAMDTGKGYAIVVGVDGFRVIAQRSKGYAGQIGPQWATGRTVRRPLIVNGAPVFDPAGKIVEVEEQEWVDAWIPAALGLPKRETYAKDKGETGEARPVAARIGIMRDGFREPLWQVVTWDEFGIEPRFKGDNWATRPAHMLGIRAETHGLRRTFPNDLSGLYTPEDFDDIDETELEAEIRATVARVESITDPEELRRLYRELDAQGMPDTVRAAIMAHAGVLGALRKEPATAEAESTPAEAPEPSGEQTPVEEVEAVSEAHTASPDVADWEAREIAAHEAAMREQDGR